VRNAKTLAQRIVEVRQGKKFQYSDDLNEVLRGIQFGIFETYAAPIYQALRMEVNQELQVLESMLHDNCRAYQSGRKAFGDYFPFIRR
jgi:16S rRNA (cytosine1402-N4)-methyltransferase